MDPMPTVSLAPDAIEPVIGWRAWALARSPSGEPELRPIVYSGETWPARHVAEARCPPHGRAGHRPPEAECTCGLYAVDGLGRLPAVIGRDVTVVGSVAMWGRLLEHDAGFRAEFAYPQDLRLVCGRCWEDGSFAPDVVGMAPTSRGTLVGLCVKHARGESTGRKPGDLQRELLSAYAVDPVSDGTIERIAAAWSHPDRRPREGRRRLARDLALTALFFGLYLCVVAAAVWLR